MGSNLYVEPLLEEAAAAEKATPQERETARALRSPQRRREYLSWRAIVRRELGPVGIDYSREGAPLLTDRRNLHLSVSHCPGWVAVYISNTPCAVDIELKTRDFRKAIPRFLTADEHSLSDDPLWPGMVWCAKEALYKFARQPGLDLLRDLRIESYDPGKSEAKGRIKNGTPVRISVRCHGDLIVASVG